MLRPRPKFPSRLLTAGVEVGLIFGGITLAIAFENWNDERGERADERSLLTELGADLRSNVDELEDGIEYDRLSIARIDSVLSHVESRLPYSTDRRGDSDMAVALLEEAVDLEATTPKHPVTPGATIPALELLGDLYLELDRPDRALASYRASEGMAPSRFNTILGLARSSVGVGDSEAAREHSARLVGLAVDDSPRAGIVEAEGYLGRQ